MISAPVITGMGFVTSIGHDRASVVTSLRDLRSGIERWDPWPGIELPVRVAGTLKGIDTEAADTAGWTWPGPWEIDRGLLRGLPPHGLYAAIAIEQALAEARLTRSDLRDGRTGLFTASAGSARRLRQHLNRLAETGWRRCHPLGVVASVAGTLGFNFAAHYGITGEVCGFVSACTSGSHALGTAADSIRLGRQDRVLVVAAEDLTPETLLPFDGMGALTHTADPATASRPFDASRDGFVGTGGAVAVVLEAAEVAARRGAVAQSRLLGWAQAADGYHVAQPHPDGDGLLRAMRLCLGEAGVEATAIDYVNAHAPSTPAGDAAEARALAKLFGNHRPLVSSTKALTGHGLSMSGLLEAAVCSLAITEGLVPGQAGLTAPDPAAASLNLPRQSLDARPRLVLNNASGFGGSNVCHLFAAVTKDTAAPL
ncbi:MAG: beta-ketoacyl-[acyl-carrier-protein] synthase family protein [Verrucomicrobiales bacterium]